MRRIASFLIVGAFATALQFAIMVVLVREFGAKPVAASAMGFVISALANYQLNRMFTFRSRARHGTALTRFAIVSGIGLALNAAVMFLLVEALHLHYVLAQAFATFVVIIWNYVLSKRWTFSDVH